MDRGGPYEMAFIHIGGGLDTFARGGRLEVDFDSDRLSPRALCVVLKQRRFEADVGPGRPRKVPAQSRPTPVQGTSKKNLRTMQRFAPPWRCEGVPHGCAPLAYGASPLCGCLQETKATRGSYRGTS